MAQVEVTIDSLRHGVPRDLWSVILKEKVAEKYPPTERFLPIWISPSQADIIAGELQERPGKSTTPSAFLSSINAAHSEIKCVVIHLDGDTFYAKLLFRHEPFEVGCLIGIALALAYRAGAPILVDETTWEKAALTVHWVWPWGAADAVLLRFSE